MGKTTGFLEYDRKGNNADKPLNRIKNFSEFKKPLDEKSRVAQAARCMNCGVPFCQSGMMLGGMMTGCPLHNLVPEWNDEIYNGHWRQAYDRLNKTNNFPEFTGRVCPALCEAACTCGMNGDPVTVRENELAVIEKAFSEGWIDETQPKRSGKRVAVIGSGPCGLAVADELNRRGHSVTVFEKSDRAGGLLMYGIPNMKLDKNIVERRIELMKKQGVEFKFGSDISSDKDVKEIMETFDSVAICCGAKKPRDLKGEGREAEGIYFAVDFLTDSTKKVLDTSFKEQISVKDKNVVIVGGGDTGNDCVGTVIRRGCKSVVQIEMMPPLPLCRTESNPWPQWKRVCKTDYGQEEAIAVFGSDPRMYQKTVKRFISDGKGELCGVETVDLAFEKDSETGRMIPKQIEGSEKILPCELLLIAAGFLGCDDYVAQIFNVERDNRGNIKTAQNRHKTAISKLFVAGDAHIGQSLVVRAIAEGRECAGEIDEFLMLGE